MHAGSIATGWKVIDDYLYCDSTTGPKLLVPNEATEDVCQYFHNDEFAGHPGIMETTRAASQNLYWPNMRTDIANHVRKCQTCQYSKSGRASPKASLHLRQPTLPFQTLSIDLMGPYPRTPRGNTHLLTVEDLFTRWVEAYPIRNVTTRSVVNQLETQFFPRYGYPFEIISDSGPQFRKSWMDYCHRHQIHPIKIPTYHPRLNPVERQNQNIKIGLRIRLNQHFSDLYFIYANFHPRFMISFCNYDKPFFLAACGSNTNYSNFLIPLHQPFTSSTFALPFSSTSSAKPLVQFLLEVR